MNRTEALATVNAAFTDMQGVAITAARTTQYAGATYDSNYDMNGADLGWLLAVSIGAPTLKKVCRALGLTYKGKGDSAQEVYDIARAELCNAA